MSKISERREAVAKAIYARNAAAASGRLPWDKATAQVREHFCVLADAAIEEMGKVK